MNHVAIFALFLVYLASASPAKAIEVGTHDNKPAETSKTQTATNSDQPGTATFPLFVKVIPAETAKGVAPEKQKEEGKDFFDEMTAWATVALAGITAVLAIYTAKLWYATKGLVEEAERAAKIQSEDFQKSLQIAKESADSTKTMVETMRENAVKELRAYVGITDLSVERDGVRVKYINSGATPAHNVFPQFWLSVGTKLTKEKIKAEAARLKAGAKEIPVGSTLWKGIETSTPIKDAAHAIQRYGPVVFVCGHISYDDVFGGRQEVCFQFEMQWSGTGQQWDFATCVGSNEAT